MFKKIFCIILCAFIIAGCSSSSKREDVEVVYPIKKEVVRPETPAPTPAPVAIAPKPVPTPPPQNEIIVAPDPPKEIVITPPPVKKTEVPKKDKNGTRPKKVVEKDYYAIRLCALPHASYYKDKTVKLEKFLKDQDISDVRIYESTNKDGEQYWVVDIGKFESMKSPEAKALLEKVQELRFEGKKQFEKAYFMKH